MAVKDKSASGKSGDGKPEFGVVFELETFAFNGRRIMYEVCRNVLSQKQIELSPILFCRHWLDHPLNEALSRLVAEERRKISPEKLMDEIVKQYQERVTKESNTPDESVLPMLAEMRKDEAVSLGALSFMSKEYALPLMERLDIGETANLLVVREGVRALPVRECWAGLAKKSGLPPRRCLALTTSALSCRAALAASMRCVAVPDEFTGFQDFGGADTLAQEKNDLSAKKLLDLLRTPTRSFRR